DPLRQELGALGRDIVRWVAEACDERLLADAIIGVTPHQRVTDGVKPRLVGQAVQRSYRTSGRWTAEEASHVSAQTVVTALRQTRVPDERKAPIAKRRVKYLFVEADEDHVPRHDGGRWQPRLVYVHEGWRDGPDGRRQLVRAQYF